MARHPLVPLAARRGGHVGHPPRKADLEQAEEIGRKERDHDRHEDEEDGLLELDPPADGLAGETEPGNTGGKHEEGDEYARRGSEETGPYLAPVAPAVSHGGNQLQRENREHAGHQVEDQPARHREQEDQPERPLGNRRGGRRGGLRGGGRQRLFGCADAVDHGKDHLPPGQAAAALWRRERRDAGERGLAVRIDPVIGRAEPPAFRPLHVDVGSRQRRVRRDRELQRPGYVPAHRGQGRDADRKIGAAPRDERGEPLDQRGFDRRGRRPSRKPKREVRDIGNANVVAGEVGNFGLDQERAAGLDQRRVHRKNDLVAVTERLEADHRKTLRRRPGERGLVEILRARPVRLRREPGIARRTPVDLPALVHPEMDAEPQRSIVADGVRRGDQAYRPVLVGPPLGRRRARFARPGGGQRQRGETEENGHCGCHVANHVGCTNIALADPGLYFESRPMWPAYREYRSAMRIENSNRRARRDLPNRFRSALRPCREDMA